MGSLLILLSVCSLLAFGNAASEDCASDKAPTWNETYSVNGIIYIPYAEIQEPFTAWYDAAENRSRIDYYGDMVQTYQLPKAITPYGTSLKLAPLSNEDVINVKTCFQLNGTEDAVVEIQSVLPELTEFECAGQETLNGEITEKWKLEEVIEEKKNVYTMWIKYKEDPDNPGVKVAVPVRFDMKGFNIVFGSHYDHYYIDYDSYDINPIPDSRFAVDSNLTCTNFPGPGNRHVYLFNPIGEFIRPEKTEHVDHEFGRFMRKHRVNYGKNKTEHLMRKEIFKQNLRLINSVNRRNLGYTLAVNHLADKTELELKALRGRQYTGKGYNGGAPFPYKNIKDDDYPSEIDWRLYGAVSPVKDQSICGSCWSFGTVGTIEGAYFVKTGKLVRFSEQALIDCSWGYGNNGCDGGEDFRSYQYIIKHGGLPTAESYGPYLGQDGYCHADSVDKVAKITGFVNVTTNDPAALKLAIFKNGPVSVAIDASRPTFSFYSNGVYYEPTCGNKEEELDHAVLAVGYGTLKDKEYWLVKNSWSNYWGNDGYILMAIQDNNCGVMTSPTYVTM